MTSMVVLACFDARTFCCYDATSVDCEKGILASATEIVGGMRIHEKYC